MNEERRFELLAYAKVCFEKGTNPFDTVHLSKKKVDVDECGVLSNELAEILDELLIDQMGVLEAQEAVEKAEIEFEETQQ